MNNLKFDFNVSWQNEEKPLKLVGHLKQSLEWIAFSSIQTKPTATGIAYIGLNFQKQICYYSEEGR